MTIVKGGRVIAGRTREEALQLAQEEYELLQKSPGPQRAPATFEEFLERETVGTVDEVLARLAEFESWGVNYMRLNFLSQAAQAAVAHLVLPRLAEEPQPALS